MKQFLFVFFLLISLFSCSRHEGKTTGSSDTLVIAWNDAHLHYMGRVDTTGPDHAVLIWPGNAVVLRFRGKKVEVLLKDEWGKNDYDIILDESSPRLLRLDTVRRWYLLADSLDEGEHQLTFFKRTEWTRGRTFLMAFRVTGPACVPEHPEVPGRRIEFYGNSITAGYAVHDTLDDRPDSTLSDNYPTYAAITARHYGADYSCIARSGIGLMVSWFPMIMPEMYDLHDPFDTTRHWDFSRWQADLVVINLGQNDSWLVRDPRYPEFVHRFGQEPPTDRQIIEAYKGFIKMIRNVYPRASIICALGSMDAVREGSPWPDYLKTAVKELNDPAVYTLLFPYLGKGGHPKVNDHQMMADTLIHFVDININW